MLHDLERKSSLTGLLNKFCLKTKAYQIGNILGKFPEGRIRFTLETGDSYTIVMKSKSLKQVLINEI
jgi:hypothetical protein